VTQLLGLLFPSAAHKLEPLEAVLVYQHFFVLKCLMESVTGVKDYVQEQFEEEFRLVSGEAALQNGITLGTVPQDTGLKKWTYVQSVSG
jgi:hypothetical protein